MKTPKSPTKAAAPKSPTKEIAKSPAKAAAPKSEPQTSQATSGIEGTWVEIRRSVGSRVSPVSDGATLEIRGTDFTVKGTLAVGLPKKGKLTVTGPRATYRDTDLVWALVAAGDTLTVTSPEEADEEHGFIYTATFERRTKKAR